MGSEDTRILEINSKRLTQAQIDAARQALFDAYKPVNSAGQQTPDDLKIYGYEYKGYWLEKRQE